jgi:hypothetical protein
MVSWCSRKQSSVALSTAQVEHIALSATVCEAVWLLTDLFDHEIDSMMITRAVCKALREPRVL